MLSLIALLTLGAAQVALSAPALVDIKPRATTITVDLSQTYQTMDGFGFSEAFGRASNLYNLPATQRSHALDLLFSTTVGAGFTILRNRIGSGGSGDSIEPTSPGSPSATPKYTWDGSEGYQVWLSQQAKTYGVTRFYANAWSAPGFMKTNGKETNGGYLCGVSGETCSSGDWKQAYANFLVQYIKDYASSGIAITHLGFLNEPDYVTSYSSMQSSGTQAADFIKVLHPTLQSAGLSSVGITCCDMVGWNDQVTATAQLISAGVESMISRITSHGYSSDPTSPMKTTRPTWMTEKETTDAWNANWYSSGSASEGFTWAQSIYTAVVNANVSAYFYWEGIEQTTNNAGLIQISGTTVNPSARLWAYAQWSRSVRPGAVRLGTSGAPSGILSGAFKNPDGSVSVQILNTGTASQSLSIATKGFTAQAVKAYLTNQSNNGVVSSTASLTGGTISATVPGKSMMTFILTGGSSSGGPVSSSSNVASTTSSHSPSTAPITSTSASTPSSTKTAAHYDQCGGTGFTGPTICTSPYTCQYTNDFYSQCV